MGSPPGRMVRVLTGLGFTAYHCRAEDGIRAVESIPKANCQTSTRHISCSLILPPPYRPEGGDILRAKCFFPEGRCCMCLTECDFLIALLSIGPFIFIRNHGKSENNHLSALRRQKSFSRCTKCVEERERVETAPMFGSQRLQESSTFDWWLQLMSSQAYVTGTWCTDIDPLPLTHLSLCWQNMDDLNAEGRLSQIRYHILAAVVSVSITLGRLLLCNTYSIIKMKQIHSRCCGLLANSERLMIFPLVFVYTRHFLNMFGYRPANLPAAFKANVRSLCLFIDWSRFFNQTKILFLFLFMILKSFST